MQLIPHAELDIDSNNTITTSLTEFHVKFTHVNNSPLKAFIISVFAR